MFEIRCFFVFLILILLGCSGDDSTPSSGQSSEVLPITPTPSVNLPSPSPSPSPTSVPTPAPELSFTQQRLQWGAGEEQFGDLYLPEGNAKAIIIMIHGGCWTAGWDLSLQRTLSEALVSRGYAIWNIEYRRLGNGGEWPTMFLDVAAAADFLSYIAEQYELNLTRLVTMGHSAGGHLALWLAGRPGISETSEIYTENPIPIGAAISLGGLPDLSANPCGTGLRILGGNNLSEDVLKKRLRNASPIQMSIRVPSLMVSGENDGISPPALNEAFVKSSARATHVEISDVGHFFLISEEVIERSRMLEWLTRSL